MGDGAASDLFATISIGAHVEEDKKSKAFKEARSYFESRQFYISAQEFSGGHGWRLELFARAMPTSNHKKLQSESIKRALHAILKRYVDKDTPSSSVETRKCSSEQSLALEQRLSQDRSDSILDETRDESVNLAEPVPPVIVQCTSAAECPASTVLQDQLEGTVFEGTDSRKLQFGFTGIANKSPEENGISGEQFSFFSLSDSRDPLHVSCRTAAYLLHCSY
jgi:hypothetical protein